jgi:hypothetical protein
LGVFAGFLGLLPLSAAQADGWDASDTHFAVDAGLTAGGDKLGTVTFTDGSTKSIYAGNSIFADGGVQYNFSPDWALKATVGYAFETVTASNASFTFDYVPMDLLAIYSHGRHHLAAGLAYHLSPHMDMDGFAPNADFDNATGFILQYQYWMFGVRYTNITYKVSKISFGGASGPCGANCSFDGSSLGVFFNYTF